MIWICLLGMLPSCQNPNTMDNPVKQVSPAELYAEPTVELATAIHSEDDPAVRQLLASGRFDLGDRGLRNMPLVLYAASLGNYGAMEQLLTAGAPANDQCDIGYGPMSILEVAVGSKNERFMNLLLDFGASPDGVNGTDPPLFRAIMTEQWDRMVRLLDAGADVNRTNSVGEPPITRLALIDRYDKVLYLLQRGADPNVGTEVEQDLAGMIAAFPLSPSTEAGQWQQQVKLFLSER